jgi:hypothetical protein
LGPARKKRLLKELGGIGAVKSASLETLVALPWLPDAVAMAVFEKIHGAGSSVGSPSPSPSPSPPPAGAASDSELS